MTSMKQLYRNIQYARLKINFQDKMLFLNEYLRNVVPGFQSQNRSKYLIIMCMCLCNIIQDTLFMPAVECPMLSVKISKMAMLLTKCHKNNAKICTQMPYINISEISRSKFVRQCQMLKLQKYQGQNLQANVKCQNFRNGKTLDYTLQCHNCKKNQFLLN